jgi:S-(hydroxymethyl)glutathione dehydrogenase / alcohol dehydrogenase
VKTRAAVFRGPDRPQEVTELDLAEPGVGEVLVHMAAVGICGTDLHMVKGEWERPTPMVLGHEGSGIVEAVGMGVGGLSPGDPVVLSWAPSCGECADCRRGRPAACVPLHRAMGAGTLLDGTTGLSLDGATVYRMTATGALSERVVVSAATALPLGPGVPLDQAALLGCAALTGVGAVLHAARVQESETVLVVGAGGVGQFVVQGARIAGASLIVAVDPVRGRLEQALRVGATHAVTPDELRDTLRGIAPDGVDVAFDAVGNADTGALALRRVRSGGRAVIVGLPPAGALLELDPGEFNRREKWLTGTMYGSEDPAVALPELLEHVRAGNLELESMVGPSFPLDEVNEAFAASLEGSPGRVLVGMG